MNRCFLFSSFLSPADHVYCPRKNASKMTQFWIEWWFLSGLDLKSRTAGIDSSLNASPSIEWRASKLSRGTKLYIPCIINTCLAYFGPQKYIHPKLTFSLIIVNQIFSADPKLYWNSKFVSFLPLKTWKNYPQKQDTFAKLQKYWVLPWQPHLACPKPTKVRDSF